MSTTDAVPAVMFAETIVPLGVCAPSVAESAMPTMREYDFEVMLDSMWRTTDAANRVNHSRTSEVSLPGRSSELPWPTMNLSWPERTEQSRLCPLFFPFVSVSKL